MSKYDYLVVGAGFFGTTIAERIANVLNKKVLVIDKRNHIGGNCFSKEDEETGIEYHVYGTHIFHTSSPHIYKYLSRFTEWNGYYHQVLTTHKNKVYQLPINLETINSFYNVNLKPFEVRDFLEKEIAKENYSSPKNLEEKAISQIGRPLYEAFIRGYTLKQWEKDPKELPESIINRLPIRSNYNESYFNNSRWEGIPLNGYTSIFEKMLSHPNIEVRLSTDYFELKDQIKPENLTIYSGPIDRYFEYSLGKLEWRTVYLRREVSEHTDFQGTSVMNFADLEVPYTRVHEPKHLHPERNYRTDKTVLFYETSGYDSDSPFYPIKDERNKELYSKYKKLAEEESNVIFGGRLSTYSYYDMDQVIGQALSIFENKILKAKSK